MAKVAVTASLNAKLKFFSEYENINPFAAITIERSIPEEWTDEQALKLASDMYDKARKVVEKKIESDIISAKGDKAKKLS